MFRNSQLLRRSQDILRTGHTSDSRLVAVLADDQSAEVNVLRPVLEKRNFRVIEANEGTAALDLALRFSASIVIAALDLPRMSGYQVCQKLREHRSTETIPFIFISPEGILPDKLIRHETFASDYVQRPISLNEFENRLSAVLRVHGPKQTVLPAPEPEVGPTPPALDDRAYTDASTDHLRAQTAGGSPLSGESRLDPSQKLSREVDDREAVVEKSFQQMVLEAGFEVLSIGPESAADNLIAKYMSKREIRDEIARLYKEAFGFLLTSIGRAEKGESVDLRKGLGIAEWMVESLEKDDGLLLLATDRTPEYSLVLHSVNVATIGTRIARTLSMPEHRMIRLCLAGILHDIGTVKLPKRLVNASNNFTPSERSEMQRRPWYSAQLVSDVSGFEWLPQIVSQVYERENGTGYPLGLKGKDICDEAKVLGVADLFEACIHHRPYRRALTGYQLLEVLTAEVDTFSERITRALIRSLSVYPSNEFVVLNTGEIGKVTTVNMENLFRPIVEVIYSADGERLKEPKFTNVAQNCSLWITRAITADELPEKA